MVTSPEHQGCSLLSVAMNVSSVTGSHLSISHWIRQNHLQILKQLSEAPHVQQQVIRFFLRALRKAGRTSAACDKVPRLGSRQECLPELDSQHACRSDKEIPG